MSFYKHSARKRFGQHWLVDESVLDKIIDAADLEGKDRVLEVGPGLGSLTERLINSEAKSVHAIEIDRDLISVLKKRFKSKEKFSLQEGDFLSVPLEFPDEIYANKVVANIPYNITGPLLEKLLGGLGEPLQNTYERIVLLLQKEVAERILAKPGNTNFSAMTIRIQLLAKSKEICNVPPNCFKPEPKVHSKVIILQPFKCESRINVDLEKRVNKLIGFAFTSRRKKLRNSLIKEFSIDKLEDIACITGISLDKRPQDLSLKNWLALASNL